MSRPSMTALLALLAIAGYQNRDKIAEMLGGLGKKDPGAKGQVGQNEPEAQAQDGLGGLLSQLDAGGASAAGMLSGGLGELLESFNKSGQGEIAKSWVSTGPTNNARRTNSSGQLVRRYWILYRSRPVYHETSC